MKKYYVGIALLLIASLSWGQTSKLIVKSISGPKELRYWPADGRQLPYYNLSPVVNVKGETPSEISLNSRETLYRIAVMGEKTYMIYSTPGTIDTVYIYKDSLCFSGPNKPYYDYLQIAEDADKYARNYSQTRNHELTKVNQLSDFKRIIETRKSKEDSLLMNGTFSAEFVKQQKISTELRYQALFLKKVISLYKAQELTSDWVEELHSIDLYLSNDLSRQSEWFYQIAEDYVCLRSFIIENISPNTVMHAIQTFLFDGYCNILTSKNLEYTLACLLYNNIFQEDYSKDIPALFERFKSLFPESPYTRLLTPGVQKIKDIYNQKSNNNNIIMMNYETEPTSFDDIIRPFSGKVIYIDVWATTCAPCLRTFSELTPLKEKAKNLEDVIFLYISLDRERNQEKWQKMIYYYDLQGYHYRTNEQTSGFIYSTLGDSRGMLMIPRYVIIDKNGKIAFPDAASPTQVDKVIEQLKTLLN